MLVLFVVFVNFLITLVNLFIAWKIWQLTGLLANLTETLTNFEIISHHILKSAPELLNTGEVSGKNLRQTYQKLKLQLELLEKVLAVFRLSYQVVKGRKGRLLPMLLQSR